MLRGDSFAKLVLAWQHQPIQSGTRVPHDQYQVWQTNWSMSCDHEVTATYSMIVGASAYIGGEMRWLLMHRKHTHALPFTPTHPRTQTYWRRRQSSALKCRLHGASVRHDVKHNFVWCLCTIYDRIAALPDLQKCGANRDKRAASKRTSSDRREQRSHTGDEKRGAKCRTR